MERQNNDTGGLTDSQLEETLDAMFFDPTFGGAADVMNPPVGESTMTSSANSATAPLPVALHVTETMPLADSFAQQGLGNIPPAQMTTNMATGNQMAAPNAPSAGTNGNRTLPTGPFGVSSVAAAPRNSKPPQANFTGRPQLFGKELTFEVPLAPPPISAVPKSTTVNTMLKRKRDSFSYAVSEDESERERRRQDRNYREQQRSQQISNQIVVLRSLLGDAKVECKPDKYSTLTSVVEYVKTLQQKSSMLESEHKKLLDTITQTTKIMNSQYMTVQSDVTANNGLKDSGVDVVSSVPEDDSQVYVQGIDYQTIFRSSPFALATTSIDGRFLDCSEGFEKLTRFSREELLPTEKEPKSEAPGDDSSSTTSDISSANGSNGEYAQSATKNLSLFNVLFQGDMGKVYHAMFDILQQRMEQMEDDSKEENPEERPLTDQWSNDVKLSRDKEAQVSRTADDDDTIATRNAIVPLTLTQCFLSHYQVKLYLNLVRTLQQKPRFFNCTLVSAETTKLKPAPMAA